MDHSNTRISMEVYLTFDDGLQLGTEEVLNVLEQNDVRGTFFLVGNQVSGFYEKDPDKCLRLIKRIYENHTIGNHSYSHANYCYRDYYKNGGIQAGRELDIWPISSDFKRGAKILEHYIRLIDPELVGRRLLPMARKQVKALARFPGRNTWHITVPVVAGGSQSLQVYQNHEADTSRYAIELYEQGYEVFGWTSEWTMSFDFHQDGMLRVREMQNSTGTHSLDDILKHQQVDMCSVENFGKDRLQESYHEVIARMENQSVYHKAVLLMHDRAFRACPESAADNLPANFVSTSSKRGGAQELNALINELKKKGCIFKTLDTFSEAINV